MRTSSRVALAFCLLLRVSVTLGILGFGRFLAGDGCANIYGFVVAVLKCVPRDNHVRDELSMCQP